MTRVEMAESRAMLLGLFQGIAFTVASMIPSQTSRVAWAFARNGWQRTTGPCILDISFTAL
eukprot:scaffold19253_cov124-Isochrysis_galbana.AAC.2